MFKTAKAVSLNLLPEKSKERYIMTYEKILKLRKINKTKSLSENIFLTDFNKLFTEIKLSTLWLIYSMLKSMKNMKYNFNVGTYLKLNIFKEKIEWIKIKNSKVLTSTYIKNSSTKLLILNI
jgi:hypothetical protein